MQQTLRTTIHAKGIGHRSGKTIRMAMHPAAPDTGIVFRRTDVSHGPEIRATLEQAGLQNGLTLTRGDIGVDGVEQLLAAFYGMGIENALVELDGPEVPAMDGSAAPFVFLLQAAGAQQQSVSKRRLQLHKVISVNSSRGWARLLPSDGLRVACLGTRHGYQAYHSGDAVLDISQAMFRTMLCHAGASRLRHADDRINAQCATFNRKDVLGALADLSLLNCSLHATYVGYNADRALNLRLMRRLIDDTSAWTMSVQPDVLVDPLVASAV